MTEDIKKFNVVSVNKVPSPSIENVTIFNALVSFERLPKDISLEVNPRIPDMRTAVAKKLIAATKSGTPGFEINNRGIVMRVKSVEISDDRSELTVDFGNDNSKYGILDGGHTYRAIIDNQQDFSEDCRKFVKLEILVGDNLDVANIADARNTSIQVSDISLFGLKNKFKFIENAIKDEPYASDVAYKDNDKKSITVSDLLRLMFAFNIKRYPDNSKAPIEAYSSKAAVFKDYRNEYDDKENNIYKKLAPVLPILVELYEKIEEDIPNKYREYKKECDNKKGQYGKVRGISNDGETTYTHTPISYDTPNGYIMPIFGAFRALLYQKEDGSIDWRYDPLKIWNLVGIALVQNTFDTSTQPLLNGKNKNLWQSNYRIVDGKYKDLLILKLERKQE